MVDAVVPEKKTRRNLHPCSISWRSFLPKREKVALTEGPHISSRKRDVVARERRQDTFWRRWGKRHREIEVQNSALLEVGDGVGRRLAELAFEAVDAGRLAAPRGVLRGAARLERVRRGDA